MIYFVHQELKNTKVFGALVGGYSLEERMRCVREVIKRPVDGKILLLWDEIYLKPSWYS